MSGPEQRPRWSRLLWVVPVLVAAIWPHLGSFSAPWISDDAAALAHVHEHGAWSDWDTPQYGMRVVRFWRPLVTTSLGLQEAWTGLDPAPLRAFNAFGAALAAVFGGLLALRLGGSRWGALAAGLLVASFPDAGGTVTWIVGRVDSLTVPLVLGAAWMALPRDATEAGADAPRNRFPVRPIAAFGLAFLAASAKEIGFVAPALAIAWGLACRSGDSAVSVRAVLRAAAPAVAGAAVAFLWRRIAIGSWIGGYPTPSLGAGELFAAMTVVARTFAPALGLLALLAVLAGLRSKEGDVPDARGSMRGAILGLAAVILAVGPLLPLLADGVIEEQNRRVLFLADACLAVAVGAALGMVRVRRIVPVAMLLIATVAVFRAVDARADVREWVAAAELADAHVVRAREAVAGEPASELPVFDATLPRNHGGAYCLAWGAADRFREPFQESARPIWPLRTMFVTADSGDRARRYVTRPRANLVWPFGESPRTVPEMPVSVDGLRLFPDLVLDVEVARGGGPMLEVWGSFPNARFEALVYTELGYEIGVLGPAMPGAIEYDPDGAQMPVVRLSLGQILRARDIATLGDALLQAADVGATRAFLELRAVDDAKGIANRPLAASRMIPLVWPADLPEQLEALGPSDDGE